MGSRLGGANQPKTGFSKSLILRLSTNLYTFYNILIIYKEKKKKNKKFKCMTHLPFLSATKKV